MISAGSDNPGEQRTGHAKLGDKCAIGAEHGGSAGGFTGSADRQTAALDGYAHGAARYVGHNGEGAEGGAVLRHDDYLDADGVVSTACPRIPGRERHPVFLGGQCH